MTDPRIELTDIEFSNAILTGKAIDINNIEHTFYKDDLANGITLENVLVNSSVLLRNLKFSHKVELSNCTLTYLSLYGCHFKKGLHLDFLFVEEELLIENCDFDFSFAIGNSSIKKELFFWGNIVSGISMSIHNNSTSYLWLYDCKIHCQFWYDSNFAKAEIDNCYLSDFSVWNISDKTSLNLTDCTVDKIVLDGFVNHSYMQWNGLKTDHSVIILEASVMGRWDIINCDFTNTRFTVHSSKITDAFYTNTKFPFKLSPPKEIPNEDSAHNILRDGYNQLKTIAQKQNDRRMFLLYQAAELESYFKTITWKENPSTWFQLFAMKWSNDFGTKWTWGAVFVLIVNLILVSLSYSLRPLQVNAEGLGNFLSGYLSSISSLITVPKYFQSNWEVNWFYIGRIPLAFGIYQTIAAFRKFGKSE